MFRNLSKIIAFLGILIFVSSCKKDDDGIPEFKERDRAEEAAAAKQEILNFLNNFFYNYEDFENPPPGFDYKIVFDSIAGDNIDKIPLIDQVQMKRIKDRVKPEVEYELYYLIAKQGHGDTARFAGSAMVNYQGLLLKNLNTF